MGASLIRLFFHDCFVNGCDGGVLLDDNGSFVGEKTALANNNSARGFELGGPTYSVPVGGKDARTASRDGANNNLPRFSHDLDGLIQLFSNQGFTAREMVALSRAHTLGQAQCVTFRDRIYNETNIDAAFATSRQANCPQAAPNGDGNLAPLDPQSPNRFGNNYYQALINRRGLLHSDQVLFNGGSTDSIVTMYSNNGNAFNTDFANAMVKMGNLNPLIRSQGEVRVNCGRVN
ncbi:hypothetical protein AAC387_Pa10g1553 [Persea americana]